MIEKIKKENNNTKKLVDYICPIFRFATQITFNGDSPRWRFVLQTEISGKYISPLFFVFFTFVFFLYFFYHSCCRKDHFTVLSIKFGANSSNCFSNVCLFPLFRERQRSKPTRPEPHGIPKQWRSCLQTEDNSKLNGYTTFPNQWKNINY